MTALTIADVLASEPVRKEIRRQALNVVKEVFAEATNWDQAWDVAHGKLKEMDRNDADT